MTFNEEIARASEDLIDALGRDVTFEGVSGPYIVRGIFEPESAAIDPYSGETVNVPPEIQGKASDLKAAKHKDTVQVDNVTYEVLEIRTDGAGLTSVTLNKIRTD